MNKIIKLFVIILASAMLFFPVLGEINSGMNNDNKDANKNDSSMMESGNNYSDSMREKVKEMYDNRSKIRDAEGMMGLGFIKSGNHNYGNYVTFSVDNNTGDILNFGISGIAVFNSIKIAGFDFKSSTTEGTETTIVNKDGSIVIKIHDNPAAVIEINSKTKSTLTYNFASGANASKQDSTIEIKAGDITAYIVSEKATSINIAGNQANINTDNGEIVFRASPVNMPHDDMEERFMEEVKTKKAGAEVSVGESDKYSIVTYSENVNVTLESIEADRMRMIINSSDPSGKFILMNIDNSSLLLNEGEKISLYLDNKPMKEVMTEQELYNASESSFWLNKTGKNRMQAMVYISRFSAHQLDIVVGAQGTQTVTPAMATAATSTPKTPGFEIALGAISIIAAVCIYRRK